MLIWLIKPSVLNWIPCTVTNECMLTHQYPLWGPLAPSRVYQCQNLGHPASQPPPDSSGARQPNIIKYKTFGHVNYEHFYNLG